MRRLSVPVLLYLLVAAVVAVSFGVLLDRMGQTAKQNRQVLTELRAQNTAIQSLLERQAEQDRGRERIVKDAVAAIAAEQRRALVAHDESVKRYLREALGLLDAEVNNPRNRERAVPSALVLPAPLPAPKAAPAPRPAPAPVPPCQTRGKSGKCRR